jgi:hypothetical protein
MIASCYEDGNDASRRRGDPLFKMAMNLTPSELFSQSTISWLENLPDPRALLRLGRAMVDFYRASFREVTKQITLDVGDTFDVVHGGQQLRLFKAHCDDHGFQPMVVFDGAGRFVAAMLRPARRRPCQTNDGSLTCDATRPPASAGLRCKGTPFANAAVRLCLSICRVTRCRS